MKPNFLILFLLSFPSFFWAQTSDSLNIIKEVDSLFLLVNQANREQKLDRSFELINEIEEKILSFFPEESALYARCINTKGGVYYYQGKFKDAEEAWLKTMSIREKVFGREHPEYSAILNNLGNLYSDFGNYEQAEDYYLKSLAIKEKTEGNEKALNTFMECLSIAEQVLGKDHELYATILENIGSRYLMLGKFDQAEQYYLDGLTIIEKVYGEIQYDYDSVSIAKATESQELNDQALATRSTLDHVDRSLRGINWKYLFWMEKEVLNIHRLLQDNGFTSTLRDGYNATETSVKLLGTRRQSPGVLHLATHGFFFPDRLERLNSRNDEPVFLLSDNPMIRSGLIFAGANRAWQLEEGIEEYGDGTLTSFEVSQLNLNNTKLNADKKPKLNATLFHTRPRP